MPLALSTNNSQADIYSLPLSEEDLTPAPALSEDFFVVRAFFSDPQMARDLSSWTEPWEVNYDKGYVVLGVTRDQYDLLRVLGFELEIDEELTTKANTPNEYLEGQLDGIPGYPCYRTVEETFTSAQDMVANYPDLAAWIDVGDSWEKTEPGGLPGYDMMVLRLTNANTPDPKPKLFIMTAVHAREYTTAELNTRFAEYLVTNYNIDPDVTWLLDHHEIHLMLQANPDGRKHAETGISWRKNTNENYCSPGSNSRGADLNRNYEFQWGCCGGSSGSECNDTYRGPSPASEPETQSVQNYVRSIFPDQRGVPLGDPAPDDAMGIFLDVHSYSELVLWPWGFTAATAPNGTALQTLGRKFAAYNNYYPEQAIGLYPTDGTTDDFAYGELGLAAYTFELGTTFFQGCGTFENTILPDNMPALVYAAKASRTPYMSPAGPDALSVVAAPAAVEPGTPVNLTATLDDTHFSNVNGTEPTQNIVAAEYYIDVPPWITTTLPVSNTMAAADGNFNNPVEDVTATIDTTGLPNGRHMIFVRGQDANGNWGVVSAAFLYIIDPAVSPVIEGYVREASTNLPLDATVTANGMFVANTDPATGYYSMTVISDTYELVAVAADHGAQTFSGIAAADYQTVTQDFMLTAICEAFSDDVEGGTNGWTAQGNWAITTEDSHSPTHSWTDSPGVNYGNYWDYAITSPIIDLTDFTSLTLNYWQICDTESGWDYCHVEVSTNGSTWTEVGVFDGLHSQWEEVNLDVSALDGQATAQIRFRLTTDVNTREDGWHVDDIRIVGAGASCIASLPPTADFTSTSPDYLGETTSFTNMSTGTDLAYVWDFGDSSPASADTHPTHDYGGLGLFTVVLTATNGLGTDVYTDVVEILTQPPPTAGFTTSSPDALGETTIFVNTSIYADTYAWDFGDGSPVVTDTNPTHVYAAIGQYTVTLTATNAAGSDAATDGVLIYAPAQAGFTTSSPDTLGETSTFTNTSVEALTHEWDFGDGSMIVTDTHPTHTYAAAGQYTVVLTATNAYGSDTAIELVDIILPPPPVAGFTSSSPDALGETTYFFNATTGEAVTYEWDFGDGSPVVTDTHPAHVYTATGAYSVTLVAVNIGGSDTTAALVEIFDPSPAQVVYTKTASLTSTMPGVVFTYTLHQQLSLTGTHTFTQTITDAIPAELDVLTSSIMLNGAPAPDLYDEATHTLVAVWSGTFTDTTSATIVFEVMVKDGVVSGTLVTNALTGDAFVDGDLAANPGPATVVVEVVAAPVTLYWNYLPVIIR